MELLATIATVLPLAAEEGERQLPRLARARADDLDAAPVRNHDLFLSAAPPSRRSARRSRSGERDPREHRGRREAARGGRRDPRRVPRASEGGARAGRRHLTRARKASDAAVAEAAADGKAKREELVAAARKDIEGETKRALEEIRKEIADLTVLATEKVTRKSLDDADHQPPGRRGPRRGRLLGSRGADGADGAAHRTRSGGAGAHNGGNRPRICRRSV